LFSPKPPTLDYQKDWTRGTLWALDAAPERFALGAVLADCGYLSSMEQPQAMTVLLLYWLQDG
jgi:hypothetical protein